MARSRQLLAAALIGIVSLTVASTLTPAADKAGEDLPQHKEWKLVFDQDFSKIKELDKKVWNVIDKGDGFGNNEKQFYTSRPDNVKIENGELIITGKKEDYKGKKYTSAKLTTEGKISFMYGRVEACIKAPKGQQGNWPAFWMLGDNIPQVGWPKCGEIDIMEVINKEDKLYATMHWGADKGNQKTLPDNKPFSDDYHVYAVEWEKGEIRSYLDGVYFGKVSQDHPFDQKFFIILNYAIGGQWPKDPDASATYPQEMRVKYVRVYQP